MPQKFKAILRRQTGGMFLATSESPTCMSRATTEAQALEGLRAEIRYRLEYCPCSGVEDDHVQLDVTRA